MATMTAPLLVTRPQLATLLGVSTRQISYLEQDGAIAPVKRGKGGRASQFDALQVVPAYYARASADETERPPRERKDLATARLTELRIAREQGQLIERELVVRAGQQYTKAWRAKLLVLARQLAQSGAITPTQVPAIDAACRRLLEEIAAWQVPDDDGKESA